MVCQVSRAGGGCGDDEDDCDEADNDDDNEDDSVKITMKATIKVKMETTIKALTKKHITTLHLLFSQHQTSAGTSALVFCGQHVATHSLEKKNLGDYTDAVEKTFVCQ